MRLRVRGVAWAGGSEVRGRGGDGGGGHRMSYTNSGAGHSMSGGGANGDQGNLIYIESGPL